MDALKNYLETYEYPWAIVGSTAIKYWASKVGKGDSIHPHDVDVLLDGDKASVRELATGWGNMKGVSAGMRTYKPVYESVDGTHDFIRNSFRINLNNKTDGYLNLEELLKFYTIIYEDEDEATQLKIAPKLEIMRELLGKDADWSITEMFVHPMFSEEDLLW